MNNRNNKSNRTDRNNRTTRKKHLKKQEKFKTNFSDAKLIKLLTVFTICLLALFLCIVVFNQIKSSLYYKNLLESSKKELETSIANSTNTTTVNSNKEEDSEEASDIRFTLCAIGDVMCHNTQYWDAYNKTTNIYDFSYVFEEISSYTKLPDITATTY